MIGHVSKSVFSVEPSGNEASFQSLLYSALRAVGIHQPDLSINRFWRWRSAFAHTDENRQGGSHPGQHPNILPAPKNLLGLKQHKFSCFRLRRSDGVIKLIVEFIN
jgi:hypothetical protein